MDFTRWIHTWMAVTVLSLPSGGIGQSAINSAPISRTDAAKQVRENLLKIVELQEAARQANGSYLPLSPRGRIGTTLDCSTNDLGFIPIPCDTSQNYYYQIKVEGSGFRVLAVSGTGDNNRIVPGCAHPDVWSVEDSGDIQHEHDAKLACPR